MEKSIYLLTGRTQLLEHYTFNRLLHVSVVYGHYRANFTTCMEKKYRGAGLPCTVIKWKNIIRTSIVRMPSISDFKSQYCPKLGKRQINFRTTNRIR